MDNLTADQKAALRVAAQKDTSPAFKSKAEFIKAIWPGAQKAAAELGVDPKVLVAQCALETGWGSKINRNADGSNTYNIFNIKADRSWKGPTAAVATHEVIGGARKAQTDPFRVYSSYDESFEDYAKFIKTNGRYANALNHGGDSGVYVQRMAAAGYATDPNYSSLILGIANGNTLNKALASIL